MENADRMFEYLGYTKYESELFIKYSKPEPYRVDSMKVIFFDKQLYDVQVLGVDDYKDEYVTGLSPREVFAINEKFTELGWAW